MTTEELTALTQAFREMRAAENSYTRALAEFNALLPMDLKWAGERLIIALAVLPPAHPGLLSAKRDREPAVFYTLKRD